MELSRKAFKLRIVHTSSNFLTLEKSFFSLSLPFELWSISISTVGETDKLVQKVSIFSLFSIHPRFHKITVWPPAEHKSTFCLLILAEWSANRLSGTGGQIDPGTALKYNEVLTYSQGTSRVDIWRNRCDRRSRKNLVNCVNE